MESRDLYGIPGGRQPEKRLIERDHGLKAQHMKRQMMANANSIKMEHGDASLNRSPKEIYGQVE